MQLEQNGISTTTTTSTTRRNGIPIHYPTHSKLVNKLYTVLDLDHVDGMEINGREKNGGVRETETKTETGGEGEGERLIMEVKEMRGERENWDQPDGPGTRNVKDPLGNRDDKGLWLGGNSLRESHRHEDIVPNHSIHTRNTSSETDTTTRPEIFHQSHVEEHKEEKENTRHQVNPLGLHLLSNPERGRGVFTSSLIPINTLIEESPVLVLSKDEWEKGDMDRTLLGSYGFCWSGGGMGIGLGLASLFNHSSTPNVNFIRSPSTGTLIFRTCRVVQPGEELCICYSADESKLWFTPAGQKSASSSLPNGHITGLPSPSSPIQNIQLPVLEEWFDDQKDVDDGTTKAERLRRKEMERLRKISEQTEKWKRRQKALDRLKSREMPSEFGNDNPATQVTREMIIHAPRPIAFNSTPSEAPMTCSTSSTPISDDSTNTSGTTSVSSTSRPFDIPAYPCLPESVISQLPTPLHSDQVKKKGTRHVHEGPVVLTNDLDWREEDWASSTVASSSSQSLSTACSRTVTPTLDGSIHDDQWAEIERVKGPAEYEEEEELIDDGLIDIWAVEVVDPKMTRVVLNFVKETIGNSDPSMRHLKRVARRQGTEKTVKEQNLIAICSKISTTKTSLIESLTSYSSLLSNLDPMPFTVPSAPARTIEQLRARSLIWPVLFSPLPTKPTDCRTWSSARRAWVRAGIERVLSDALKAKSKGEIPCSVYCTSAPESLWPSADHFIPPTIGLRASSHDTRISENNHPLRHSTLNCIASIANLRTVPPFSEMIPTRNGADYLLTSLSLFISHEPCVMCSMALLHSRVREVFYVFPREKGGGFGGAKNRKEGFGIHGHGSLNHRFEVWRWLGDVGEGVEEALRIDDGINL